MPRSSNSTSINDGILFNMGLTPTPLCKIDILGHPLERNMTSAYEKQLRCMVKCWKAGVTDWNGFTKRRPTVSSGVYSVHLGVAQGGGYFEGKKFHFIFSIFLHRRFEPTCFHRFFHWGQSSKIEFHEMAPPILPAETLVKSASVETTTSWWVPCWVSRGPSAAVQQCWLLSSVVIVTGRARDGVWCSLWEWGESICEVHLLVALGNVKIAAGQAYVWNAYQLKS